MKTKGEAKIVRRIAALTITAAVVATITTATIFNVKKALNENKENEEITDVTTVPTIEEQESIKGTQIESIEQAEIDLNAGAQEKEQELKDIYGVDEEGNINQEVANQHPEENRVQVVVNTSVIKNDQLTLIQMRKIQLFNMEIDSDNVEQAISTCETIIADTNKLIEDLNSDKAIWEKDSTLSKDNMDRLKINYNTNLFKAQDLIQDLNMKLTSLKELQASYAEETSLTI